MARVDLSKLARVFLDCLVLPLEGFPISVDFARVDLARCACRTGQTAWRARLLSYNIWRIWTVFVQMSDFTQKNIILKMKEAPAAGLRLSEANSLGSGPGTGWAQE